MAEFSLPAEGLCFAGVGYDIYDLSIYKNMGKREFQKLQDHYKSLNSSFCGNNFGIL